MSVKAGVQAIIMKISEDAQQHGDERYSQIKCAIDHEIESENVIYQEESDKQREVLRKHNEHEYARRLEYQRSRLNRELLVYQHELASEIFAVATEKLKNISDDAFLTLFRAALRGLSGNFTLQFGALSQGKLNERAIEKAVSANTGLTLTGNPKLIPNRSGFVLRDDRVEYSFLFEDMVEDMKGDRVAAIINEVFGDTRDWMFT